MIVFLFYSYRFFVELRKKTLTGLQSRLGLFSCFPRICRKIELS